MDSLKVEGSYTWSFSVAGEQQLLHISSGKFLSWPAQTPPLPPSSQLRELLPLLSSPAHVCASPSGFLDPATLHLLFHGMGRTEFWNVRIHFALRTLPLISSFLGM